MSAVDERRRTSRHDLFWVVNQEDQQSLLGYLVDLSESGMRVWLKLNYQAKESNFTVCLLPPNKLELPHFVIDVRKVWLGKDETDTFDEIGCEFVGLNVEQKKSLAKMLSFFQEDKEHFFDHMSEMIQFVEEDLKNG